MRSLWLSSFLFACSPPGSTSVPPPPSRALVASESDGGAVDVRPAPAPLVDETLPAPVVAQVVAVHDGKVLLALEASRDAQRVGYYAVLDAKTLCVEETIPSAATAHVLVARGAADPEIARLHALAVRFGRRTLGGLVFDDAGQVVAHVDLRGLLYVGASLVPGQWRPAPVAGQDPAQFREDSLAVTADGRVVYGTFTRGGKHECAAAVAPSGAPAQLACVRTRSAREPSFVASPHATHFALVERTAANNQLRVYRIPPLGKAPILSRDDESNYFVLPSSFLHVALDEEGHAAWDFYNDFGMFVGRKDGWQKQNAVVAGFVAADQVLVMPAAKPGEPENRTLGEARCDVTHRAVFEAMAKE